MLSLTLRIALAAIILAAISSEATAVATHPCLMTTPAGIERARKRVRTEPWARDIVRKLEKHAEVLESEKLPVFEKDWWKEASKKRWQDIYPEVNHHTMFAVVGPMTKAADTAILYAATGDTKYAQLVRKVLLHYTRYEFFAEHPDVGLNWSVWCLRALYAYDIIYPTLPQADRAEIDSFFNRAMQAIKAHDEWWIRENPGGQFNNHFAWHKLFIGTYGLFYGRQDLLDYAMESNQGIRELIENGSRDDGLWLESSLNYHFTAVDAIAALAHHLRNSGHSLNLWNHRFANGRSLKGLLTAPIGVLFPDETLPTIGDSYGARKKLGSVRWYWAAYDAYRLPEIAWILRDCTERPAEALFLEALPTAPTAPSMKTRIWPEHGYIALRTQEGTDYWRGDGYSVFLSFDLDGIHSHRDKFGLMVFAKGSHIAIDPEALSSAQHAFSSNIQSELNRSTICHNTVMVDGRDHNPIGAKLELVDFVDVPDTKLATVADSRGLVVPGVRMSRTVAAAPDYVLDVFQVASDEEHVYDYLFHGLDNEGVFRTDGNMTSVDLPCYIPWRWLKNARQREVSADWHVVGLQGNLTARLTVLGEPGTNLITCEFPSKDNLEPPSYPMLVARRKARQTVFVSVLQAERGALPPIKLSAREDRHGLMRVSVDCQGLTREFSVRRIR
jgi:hypothetical protein